MVASATRLLIVEDDAASANALKEILESPDNGPFAVQLASTAAEACEIVERREADVVLLDLGLPDARDLEALMRLHECVTETPVIVLTGNGDERLALEALNHGAEDYLLKAALDRAALVRSIRYAIERHRNVRELARVKGELERANENLERLTLIDPLTDLLNRRGLQRALTREMERLKRSGLGAAALLIDLDDFRQINTTFGHAVGDVVLKEIARRIRGSVRGIDFVGRLGGDEFLMLLPEPAADEIVRIAERIRLTIATTIIQHSTGSISLTASIAALMLSQDTPSVDQLLAHSGELLSRAKANGKNRIEVEQSTFDDTDRRRRAQMDMCANLSKGKHLLTLRQPIVRLSDEMPVAYEFLSRYSNGSYEMPDHFFRVCSERNILTVVDHFCLRKAVDAATKMPGAARFHINVFPSTVIAIPPEHVLQAFPTPLPRDRFCLEISEQQIIGDPSYLLPAVRELRKGGLSIAIDDVGCGNSCLESLVLFEPEVMKIDKRCVIGVAQSAEQRRQLRRYIALASALDADVVAEGVENPADLAVLRDLGIDYAQGFYWGQPA